VSWKEGEGGGRHLSSFLGCIQIAHGVVTRLSSQLSLSLSLSLSFFTTPWRSETARGGRSCGGSCRAGGRSCCAGGRSCRAGGRGRGEGLARAVAAAVLVGLVHKLGRGRAVAVLADGALGGRRRGAQGAACGRRSCGARGNACALADLAARIVVGPRRDCVCLVAEALLRVRALCHRGAGGRCGVARVGPREARARGLAAIAVCVPDDVVA
jgi:hypothetical protein